MNNQNEYYWPGDKRLGVAKEPLSRQVDGLLGCPFCGEEPLVGHGKAKCVNDKCLMKVVCRAT